MTCCLNRWEFGQLDKYWLMLKHEDVADLTFMAVGGLPGWTAFIGSKLREQQRGCYRSKWIAGDQSRFFCIYLCCYASVFLSPYWLILIWDALTNWTLLVYPFTHCSCKLYSLVCTFTLQTEVSFCISISGPFCVEFACAHYTLRFLHLSWTDTIKIPSHVNVSMPVSLLITSSRCQTL